MIATSFDKYIETLNGKIFVRSWSHQDSKTQPPIILLHDSLGSTEQWRDFPLALNNATNRTIISYDRLGFGKSGKQTDKLTKNFIKDEALGGFAKVLNEFGLDQFVVFGHSVGGAMALEIAAHYGNRCCAVITEAAQAFVEEKTLQGIRAAKINFENQEQFEKLRKWHGDKSSWVLDAWTETWLHPHFQTWNLDNALPNVTCPTLILHGNNDEFGSIAFPKRIAAGVQGSAVMVILENCGHVPHREHSQKILELVSEFLHKISS